MLQRTIAARVQFKIGTERAFNESTWKFNGLWYDVIYAIKYIPNQNRKKHSNLLEILYLRIRRDKYVFTHCALQKDDWVTPFSLYSIINIQKRSTASCIESPCFHYTDNWGQNIRFNQLIEKYFQAVFEKFSSSMRTHNNQQSNFHRCNSFF